MSSTHNNEVFFILFNNGETFYFNLINGEIYCKEFKKIYGENMVGASVIQLSENGFSLKQEDGTTIYTLEQYLLGLKNSRQLTIPDFENSFIERLYINADVRTTLLAKEKLIYSSEASNIPGLLYEPIEEKQQHIRTRRK